jgi:DNA-binding NtrC family response regulator
MDESGRVLVVDDDPAIGTVLSALLKQEGLGALWVASAESALAVLEKSEFDVVLSDVKMPGLDGMGLLDRLANQRPDIPVVLLTAHGTVPMAVDAMKRGAADFLLKPFDSEEVLFVVRKALATAASRAAPDRPPSKTFVGTSAVMRQLGDLVRRAARGAATVLIIGETGTGKEQIAQAIHQASAPHRSGSMIAVNCAAIPESLLESELFGHEKGSFTGAIGQRKGRFEQAHGGTLFLDEVGDIPLSVQVKLLRVLQERRIERVGGTDSIDIDVRVIAATHQELEKLVKEGKFREDLFYRLNVIRIEVPPLRERPEDIPVLAAHFAQKYSRMPNPPQFSPDAMEMLTRCTWPGNVRQLENAIERACVTARDGVIEVANLPPDVLRTGDAKPHPLRVDLSRALPEQLAELTAAYEERYIRKALRKTRGHVGKCAELSGLSRRSITEKITLYKIDKDEFKNA